MSLYIQDKTRNKSHSLKIQHHTFNTPHADDTTIGAEIDKIYRI